MMKEYIERERIINHLKNCIDEVKNTNGCTDDFEICLRAVKNQPTANVQEAMYGKWEINDINEEKKEITVMCSECGYTYILAECDTPQDFFIYCPNCGAKMDKE